MGLGAPTVTLIFICPIVSCPVDNGSGPGHCSGHGAQSRCADPHNNGGENKVIIALAKWSVREIESEVSPWVKFLLL